MDPNQLPRIVPSRALNYWQGTPVDGQPITAEQARQAQALAANISRNRARYQLPATYGVKAHNDRPTKSSDLVPTVYVCPVVSCTKDRKRLQVISPSGTLIWVNWSHR